MALASTGLPCAITDNSSTARARLGDLYGTWSATYGHQIWRYVQNKSGGDYTVGLGVMQENGTDLYESGLSGANTPTPRMLGIAQHTISNGNYGFVLCNGVGVVVSDGSTTADTPQVSVAAGQFTDWLTGTDAKDIAVCVHALETEAPAAAGGFFKAHIRCL
jgi:hypothetical protein